MLDVLDESLIPKAESGESKVFYHKMYVMCSQLVKENKTLGAFQLLTFSTGRVIITAISQNLHQARNAKLLLLLPTRRIR